MAGCGAENKGWGNTMGWGRDEGAGDLGMPELSLSFTA